MKMKKNKILNKTIIMTQVFLLLFSLAVCGNLTFNQSIVAAGDYEPNDYIPTVNDYVPNEYSSSPSNDYVQGSKYGVIYGTITDNEGVPFVGAYIGAYSTASHSKYTTFSTDEGEYRIKALSGIYTVDSYLVGYTIESIDGVVVEMDKETRLDLVMQKSTIPTAGSSKIQGFVNGIQGDEEKLILLKGVQITVYEDTTAPVSNQAPSIVVVVATTYTNAFGRYDVALSPGTYNVVASRGLSSDNKNVHLLENETKEIDFVLPVSTVRKMIDDSITEGNVGGELTVKVVDDKPVETEIILYNGVSITPVDISSNKVSLTVSGDEGMLGKTIAINAPQSILDDSKQLTVMYDAEQINMANDIADILNPNDDGSLPEYYVVTENGGKQVLVSIPHFSEHSITVSSVIEALGGTTVIAAYVVIAVVAAVFFIGAGEISKRF